MVNNLSLVSMPTLATNKTAAFNYSLLENFEAGIVLSGSEVKSVRNGGLNLKDAFVTFHNGQALLTNAHISPYKFSPLSQTHDPKRSCVLLLRRKEMNYLRAKAQEQGLTIVAVKVYTKRQLIKVEIAVARGKHAYDKREDLKKKDLKRELRQEIS